MDSLAFTDNANRFINDKVCRKAITICRQVVEGELKEVKCHCKIRNPSLEISISRNYIIDVSSK